MIGWVISQYPDLRVKPVRLTYEGRLFWQSMVKRFPNNIDPVDYSVTDYLAGCGERTNT